MKLENLQRITTTGVSFDTETHLIQPGLIAPPIVCASVAKGANGQILDKTQALEVLEKLLDTSAIIIGANIPYDMLVMAMYAARQGVNLLPRIFDKYNREEVYDIQIAEQLHALAEGHLGVNPRTHAPLKSPSTGKPAHYSLEVVTDLVLGRANAKVNDRWRLSYALLEDMPISEWPDDARTYPIDDAINTIDCAIGQTAPAQGSNSYPSGGTGSWPMGYTKSADGRPMRNRNLHDLSRQCYTAWCLHLGAAWGFNVDPAEIEKVKATTQAAKLAGQKSFLDLGLLKEVKVKGELLVKKHTINFKTMIADAYGCKGVCRTCDGLGTVPGATPCPKTKHKEDGCIICHGFGFKPKTCKGCDGTSYDLDSAPLPRTEKGGIAGGRDPLYESGDENLIDFAAWGEQDKILTTYIPWLEKGINDAGLRIPLNPRPKVLKETGRIGASTEHQLPREGGVRECITARPGWLLFSCDWKGAELVTHAQNCLEMIGWSKMAEALNGGLDVHGYFGAAIGGVSYEELMGNLKTDPAMKALRQTAKPLDFGLPGLMGAATLVLQQRKQGPDTTAPSGRKYKGLRFCILAGAKACGVRKTTAWKGRDIPPTCVGCLEVAERNKAIWLETFPENVEYFEQVKRIHNTGEMLQPYSNRVRGGMSLCATANGGFQGRAGDMMKLAICRMSEEMYTKKSSDLYGARLIIPIHDEAFGEVRAEQASAAAKRLSKIMVETMIEVCPDMASAAEAEPALMFRWDKNAEPVWDGDTLVPWTPKEETA